MRDYIWYRKGNMERFRDVAMQVQNTRETSYE